MLRQPFFSVLIGCCFALMSSGVAASIPITVQLLEPADGATTSLVAVTHRNTTTGVSTTYQQPRIDFRVVVNGDPEVRAPTIKVSQYSLVDGSGEFPWRNLYQSAYMREEAGLVTGYWISSVLELSYQGSRWTAPWPWTAGTYYWQVVLGTHYHAPAQIVSPLRSFTVTVPAPAPAPAPASAPAPAVLGPPSLEWVRAKVAANRRVTVRFKARPALSTGTLFYRLILRGPRSSQVRTGTWSGTGSLVRQIQIRVPATWVDRRVRVAVQVWNAVEKNTASAVVGTTTVRPRA